MKYAILLVLFILAGCATVSKDDLVNCRWENGDSMSEDACNSQRKMAPPQQRMRFKDEIEKAEKKKFMDKLNACTGKSYRDLKDAEKTAISKAITDQLKDPESARFKWIKMVGDSIYYCGLVNAKNSYGGYTGYKPFDASFVTAKDGKIIMLNTSFSDKDDLDSFTKKCAEECYISFDDAM